MNESEYGRPKLCLKSVSELLEVDFTVPAYQRGYRWTPQQVNDLLDDISYFQKNPEAGSYYCLQPIVVRAAEGRQERELVDGQQRLATIKLILLYLKKLLEAIGKKPPALQYQTRDRLSSYLEGPDEAGKDTSVDTFHVYRAYQTVGKWFENNRHDGTEQLAFLQCMLNTKDAGRNVQVIWYELPPGTRAVDVFTRLNVGKIPLTNSELIRALFLRRGDKLDEASRIRQLRIAQEWDDIEKKLQSDALWYFIQKDRGAGGPRIEFIFDLMAREDGHEQATRQPGDQYRTFRFFSERVGAPGDADGKWRKVKQTFMSLEEWFNDRALYHLVGYLVHTGTEISDLQKCIKDQRKSQSESLLKARIFKCVFGNGLPTCSDDVGKEIEGKVGELEYGNTAIKKCLLLFNIASLLAKTASTVRFPFDSYAKQDWDIEHIHARKDDMPRRPEDQERWLQDLCKYWKPPDKTGAAELVKKAKDLLNPSPPAANDFSKGFQELYEEVISHFAPNGSATSGDGGENALGNLALLDSRTNRAYKNHIFPVKRNWILELDSGGEFVPPCTRNLFLKCYSKSPGDLMVWSQQDREDYEQKIIDTLKNFFCPR